MPKRYVPEPLTPVEREVQRDQGRHMGADIDGVLVRDMTDSELRARLFEWTEEADKSKSDYAVKQRKKLEREFRRRHGRAK